MYSSLINWIQRQVWRENPDPDPPAIPPLPFLPTPPSSSENVTTKDVATIVPTPNNGIFFERLPSDLRRIILIEAFGDRVVHMDLRYDRPLLAGNPRSTLHAGGINISNPYNRQTEKPHAWQWYSCICHRDPEWCVRGHLSARAEDLTSTPVKDSCLRGRFQSCHGLLGDSGDMSMCFLGVMGWLMTCRQAYFEGFDILYSTNRFHISGMPLIEHLPRLLPTKALSDIESVEMEWNLGMVARPPLTDQDISADERFHGWRMFLSLLNQLPKSLPRLRYLHITLRGTWFPPQMAPNDRIRLSEPAMLQPMDEMMRNLYRESEWSTPRYIVAIPASVFRARMSVDDSTLEDGQEDIIEPLHERRLVWRSLESEMVGQLRSNSGIGYWLEEGIEDVNNLVHEQSSIWRVRTISVQPLLAGDW
ncbi:hypothetical protein N8I77_013569 [Diaporthe amygdali]|uniref:DUF7730 domain-containing protein n=1 Tax=Phomopsis amygdali TaxID=1214568 RepID=A0AAD9S0Z8_PHOAM|nr:hypothetical protein N8I77_013569 [Diaporthe amygdali]